MSRYIEGQDRQQMTLLPECLDDFIAEDNPIRVVDAFVTELNLKALGFAGSTPAATGRPSYHPSVLLKIYIYGYLNRVQSSRRLERECQRNVELMWLTGRLAPDFKTIADFRRDNGTEIRNVCHRFVTLCRELKMFTQAIVAIDGSKFKAVNSRDRNFSEGKIDRRQEQVEQSIQRYLDALETADRTQPAELEAKSLSVNYVDLELHFAERDDGGSYVVQRDEAAFEFLVSHQQLAETIEPAVADFDHPAPSLFGRVTPLGSSLFASINDVRNVAVRMDDLQGRSASVSEHRRTGVCFAACSASCA